MAFQPIREDFSVSPSSLFYFHHHSGSFLSLTNLDSAISFQRSSAVFGMVPTPNYTTRYHISAGLCSVYGVCGLCVFLDLPRGARPRIQKIFLTPSSISISCPWPMRSWYTSLVIAKRTYNANHLP